MCHSVKIVQRQRLIDDAGVDCSHTSQAMNTSRLRERIQPTQTFNALCVSLKHNVVVMTRREVGLVMFSLASGAFVRDIPVNNHCTPGCICTTPDDDNVIFAGCERPQLQVFSVAAGSHVTTRRAHMDYPCYVDCKEDMLLVGSCDSVVVVSWSSDALLHTFSWPICSYYRPRLVSNTTAAVAYMFIDGVIAWFHEVATDGTVERQKLLASLSSSFQQCMEDPDDGSVLALFGTKLVRLSPGARQPEIILTCPNDGVGFASLPDGGFIVVHLWSGFSMYDTTALRHAWMALCVLHA